MAARLTDRDSLKRALYRLTNTDDLDDAMLEHDATSLDGVYMALQEGADGWGAQAKDGVDLARNLLGPP